MLSSGVFVSLNLSRGEIVVNARIGLKVLVASFISCEFLTEMIFGTVRFWAMRLLKPSRIMISVLSLQFLVMSPKLSFVVSVFLIVAISLGATAVVICAPAFVCLHVSRPLVSIVKFGSGMCLAVATL